MLLISKPADQLSINLTFVRSLEHNALEIINNLRNYGQEKSPLPVAANVIDKLAALLIAVHVSLALGLVAC